MSGVHYCGLVPDGVEGFNKRCGLGYRMREWAVAVMMGISVWDEDIARGLDSDCALVDKEAPPEMWGGMW